MLLAFLLVASWPGCARHTPAATDRAFPSGERATNLDTRGDSVPNVNRKNRHIFYISYDTADDIGDVRTLRQEALRVWAVYKPDFVGADYDTCAVTPMKQTASGGAEAGHPFYFRRLADKTWTLGE